MNKKRVGIYGGTFAPIHNGHIKSALSFLDQAKLDVLYIIPDFIPPHKMISADDDPMTRLQMTRIAFSSMPLYGKKIFVSDYEIENKGKSYTYLTLEHFKNEDCQLFFLCGTDMFLTIDLWRKPEVIFADCTVAVARRKFADKENEINTKKEKYIKEFGADILEIIDDPIEISSSEIREMIKNGIDVSSYVPSQVYEFIKEKGLYV